MKVFRDAADESPGCFFAAIGRDIVVHPLFVLPDKVAKGQRRSCRLLRGRVKDVYFYGPVITGGFSAGGGIECPALVKFLQNGKTRVKAVFSGFPLHAGSE